MAYFVGSLINYTDLLMFYVIFNFVSLCSLTTTKQISLNQLFFKLPYF